MLYNILVKHDWNQPNCFVSEEDCYHEANAFMFL